MRIAFCCDHSSGTDSGGHAISINAIVAFWGVTVLLIIAPGADWAYTLSATLRGNAIRSAVAGLVTGYLLVTLAVVAGVGAVVADSAMTLTVITVFGGCYLVWLGISTLRHPDAARDNLAEDSRTELATFIEGIGVSGLNPKGLLIFIALLPQFTSPRSEWPVTAQMGTLGVTFVLTCGVFYALLGAFAAKVLHARPAAGIHLSRVSGAGMVIIGTLLVAQRLAT